MLAAVPDQSRAIGLILGGDGARRRARQDLRKADDRVQGRPQFVADGSQKTVLGVVRLLRLRARRRKRELGGFAARDIFRHGDDLQPGRLSRLARFGIGRMAARFDPDEGRLR